MDQRPLSLKLFKKKQNKTKEYSLFLKRRRSYKKKFPLFLTKELISGPKLGFSTNKHQTERKKVSSQKKNKITNFYLLEKGQILIEGLFFIICILSFFLAIQFFQSLARKEIQNERLSKQKIYKTKKAPWIKPTKYKE